MKVDKQQIIGLLREQGDHGKAQQAERELPDEVDHEEHSDLLERLGVDAQDVMKKIL